MEGAGVVEKVTNSVILSSFVVKFMHANFKLSDLQFDDHKVLFDSCSRQLPED